MRKSFVQTLLLALVIVSCCLECNIVFAQINIPAATAQNSYIKLTTKQLKEDIINITQSPYNAVQGVDTSDIAQKNAKAIQQACNDASTLKKIVFIPNGTYYFDSMQPVTIPDNVEILMESKAIIQTRRRAGTDFNGIFIAGGSNIKIYNGKLCGDRKAGDLGGQGGFGIYITGRDVLIDGTETCNFRGDGFYINSYKKTNGEVILNNVNSHDNTRQGLTISNGINITIENSRFNSNYSNDDPGAGIDIEPYPPETECLKNIKINNIETKNNKIGLLVQLCGLTALEQPAIDITINDITGGGNTRSKGDFVVQGPSKVYPTGIIAVNGQNWNGNYEICTWTCLSKMKITIDGQPVNLTVKSNIPIKRKLSLTDTAGY